MKHECKWIKSYPFRWLPLFSKCKAPIKKPNMLGVNLGEFGCNCLYWKICKAFEQKPNLTHNPL